MSKHQTVIELPDGFSFEWPSYNLVLNVSPFPVFNCLDISEVPEAIEDDLIWIKINPHRYGLYEKKLLLSIKCPLCGRALNGDYHEQ